MKDWLKFFGLGFFSDKIAKQAKKRGIMHIAFGFVFALLFIFCGILAANTVPFKSHYNGAPNYKSFIQAALGKGDLTLANGLICADKIVNTFENSEDSQKYSLNGFNFVIDTRPYSAYDDFEAYCVATDGSGREITYSDYLILGEEKQKDYAFRIRYTPNELVLTEDSVKVYEDYLSASEDENIKKQYQDIIADKQNLKAEDYFKSVYVLYLKAYYPDISAYERDGIPRLRNYYAQKYLSDSAVKNYLFVFDDLIVGDFQTYGELPVQFYGYCNSLADAAITADNADEFILDAFYAKTSTVASVYLINMFRLLPFIAIIPVLCALLLKVALTLLKDEKYKQFGTCFKIVCCYLTFGSLISLLIIFICGFFVTGSILNYMPLIALGVTLLFRTALFVLSEYLSLKRDESEKSEKIET